MRRIHHTRPRLDDGKPHAGTPLTVGRVTRTIAEWAVLRGLTVRRIVRRLARGLKAGEALAPASSGYSKHRSSRRALRVGAVFGCLRVLGRDRETRRKGLWARVVCTCGTELSVLTTALTYGESVSCGCSVRDRTRWQNLRHRAACRGHIAPEYRAWRLAISRCEDPNVPAFRCYGARGIRVCERWRLSFVDFRADVGPRPSPEHRLRRLDPAGHYEPGNVVWTTERRPMTSRAQPSVDSAADDGKLPALAASAS